MIKLNKQQQQAVHSNYQHSMVLAGAGTGKTRTIIHRIFFLVEKGILPKKIVVLTFTRKSANELIYRLRNQLSQATNDIFIGTFHQFCIYHIRHFNLFFNAQQYRIIDKEEQLKIVRNLKKEKHNDLSITPSELLQYISYAQNCNISIADYLEKYQYFELEIQEKIINIQKNYQQHKKSACYLDFDDILSVFASTISKNNELRELIWERYTHLLVDEMQDTNPIQWKILEAVAPKTSLFCVGDDAQSIYMFRGADFRNVQNFTQKLNQSNNLKLKENFRSTQEILDLANWLLEQSDLPYKKKLIAYRGRGKKPEIHNFKNDSLEANWVTQEIQANREKYGSYHEQMVLVRSAWNARKLEAQLVENSIPYVFIGGLNLMSGAHTKDLLSLLQLAVFPKDKLAWIRYLLLWPKIGQKTAEKIYLQISQLQNHQEIVFFLKNRFSHIPALAGSYNAVCQNALSAYTCLEVATNQLEALLSLSYDNWELRKKDLLLLKNMSKNHPSLKDFLEVYTLEPIYVNNTNDISDKVTIITVHSAKGLEARICYLLKAQENIYPHQRSIGDLEAEEEERRVLYVAMTRAKDKLYITRSLASSLASDFYMQQTEGIKYFLQDIPENLVEFQNHFF